MVTEETLKAIEGRRNEIADIRCTSRGAIDQMAAGNTKDPFSPQKDWLPHVCLGGGNPFPYQLTQQKIINRTIDLTTVGADAVIVFVAEMRAHLAELEQQALEKKLSLSFNGQPVNGSVRGMVRERISK